MTLDIPKKRLVRATHEPPDAAKLLPPGVDQARLLRRACEAEAVAQLDEILKR
jgi:hypothetical protein